MDFFGTPWADLTLGDVERFLAPDEREEGLTWETKGTEVRRGHVWKSVAGLANQVGGFLILGARRVDGGWTVDGVTFDDEPRVWLTNQIVNGLRPVPDYDVTAFPVGAKHVAVVSVAPVAEPPCLTSRGQLYQRVSGATVAVTDPVAVARLMERGRAARTLAQETADQAVDLGGFNGEPPLLRLTLAMSAIGRAVDVSSALFRGMYEHAVVAEVDRLPTHVLFMHADEWVGRVHTYQDSIVAASASQPGDERWSIKAAWDGSVRVRYEGHATGMEIARVLSEVLFPEILPAMARAALRLSRDLGGYGPAHLVFELRGRGVELRHEGQSLMLHGTPTIIRRWTAASGDIDHALLDSVRRELLRSLGVRAWEPE